MTNHKEDELLSRVQQVAHELARFQEGMERSICTGSLTIVDDHGRARGSLYVDDENTARVSLHDIEGTQRTCLSVDEDGQCSLVLRDVDGTQRVTIQLSASGQPSIRLSEPGGTVVTVGADCPGKTGLFIRHEGSEEYLEVALDEAGKSFFVMRDREGRDIRIGS